MPFKVGMRHTLAFIGNITVRIVKCITMQNENNCNIEKVADLPLAVHLTNSCELFDE